jgi:hypothetical protein
LLRLQQPIATNLDAQRKVANQTARLVIRIAMNLDVAQRAQGKISVLSKSFSSYPVLALTTEQGVGNGYNYLNPTSRTNQVF